MAKYKIYYTDLRQDKSDPIKVSIREARDGIDVFRGPTPRMAVILCPDNEHTGFWKRPAVNIDTVNGKIIPDEYKIKHRYAALIVGFVISDDVRAEDFELCLV